MTSREALEVFNETYISGIRNGKTRITEALYVAIGALEKQTPCPVKITASTKRCGACNRQLSSNRNTHLNYNYCPKCGQAIDWRTE
jgi:predicted RNA-binding Zn-ribbon protein involved in translation (DUF1610 family)